MPHGTVIVIGGAEDKVRDRVILGRFVALAGGRDARIAVIATASSFGLEAGERYRSVFTELGAAEVMPLNAVTRMQANDEHAARIVRDSSGIFLTGGNQLRLSSMLGGTRLADAIMTRFMAGAVVAGTSAGASAVSSHMIAFGASGATPKHRMAADRGGPRAAAGRDRGPALPAAEPARAAAVARSPRTRRCSASAWTRTPPAWSDPTR